MKGLRVIAIKFLAFAAVSICLLVLLVNTMLNGVAGDTRPFYAEFKDVAGLTVGDDIKVAGVRVGRVSSIAIDGDGAKVGLEMEQQQPLLDNTKLVMRYQNLVGQRYLSLIQPAQHGAELKEGATIPMALTDPGFDLTGLLNGFRPLFEVLQPADVNKLATSIVKVLQGEGGTIESLLQQTTQLSQFVVDRDQIIGQVATNLTPVLNNLSGQGTQLTTTIVELKKLMGALAKDRKAIGTAIDGVGQLVTSTAAVVDQVRDPLLRAVQQLRAVSAMLASSTGEIKKGTQGLDAAVAGLGRVTSYEDAANLYICTLKIGLLGSTSINPAANGRQSEVCR